MNNEEHTSVLREEFKTLYDEYGHMLKVLEDDEDGWDIPIGSNSLPREPNLDFTSIAEMLSKD